MPIGDRLRDIRESKDQKQTDVSRYTYISNKVLSSYERNISLPTLDNLITLCDYYHVSADFVLQTQYYQNMVSHSDVPSGGASDPESVKLTPDQLRMLYYYERLTEENKDVVKGLMVTYYKEQLQTEKRQE